MKIESILFFLTCLIIGGLILAFSFMDVVRAGYSKRALFNFIFLFLLLLYPGLVLTINLFSSEFEFIAELSVRLRNDLAFFPWALQGLYSLAISLEFRDRVKLYGKKFDKFIQRLSFLGFLVTFVYVLTYIF